MKYDIPLPRASTPYAAMCPVDAFLYTARVNSKHGGTMPTSTEAKALRNMRHPTRIRALMELREGGESLNGPGFQDFAQDEEQGG